MGIPRISGGSRGWELLDSGYKNVEDLIGIPFVDKGRDPGFGLDCWGLFLVATKRFGINAPDVDLSAFATKDIEKTRELLLPLWRKTDIPRPGDAVAIRNDPEYPAVSQHYGVYLGDGRFLHTLEKTGSIITRVDHPYWKLKIEGYYRWNR
jgi:cell wall-associated NlpC family hydrolase